MNPFEQRENNPQLNFDPSLIPMLAQVMYFNYLMNVQCVN